MAFTRILFEVSSELQRVGWPSRDTVANHTIVVLATLAACTTLIAGLDYVFGGGVLQLLRLGS